MRKIQNIVIFFIFIILSITKSYCLPTNPSVMAGTLITDSINANEINLHVADKTIINWNDFSININETVNFLQPSDIATVLNRVTGNSQSEILGRLKANGNLFLINPNGVLIGKDATIETASFLASTLNLSDTDFLNNNYRFISPGIGSIINYGTIKTINGDVTILGKTIRNEGDIEANGNFNVGLGEEIFLQDNSNDKILIKIKLTDGEGFSNTKTIQAIKHEIKANGNPNSYAINLDGEIIKSPIAKEEGRFYLSAENGEISIAKHIKQDDIVIEGQKIYIAKDAQIETKTKGTITINSKDQIEINGVCQALEGTIAIKNESNKKVCFNQGKIDVSGDLAGKIDLVIPKLINTGILKADSKTFQGGSIQINTERMIETQNSSISANSEQNVGGTIDIFAKNHFFTSGNHSVTGKNRGGTIQIATEADDLYLVSNKQSAFGKVNGHINLQSNKNVKITSKTHLLGFLQYNQQQLSVSPDNFETVDLVDPNLGGGSEFGDSIVALNSGNVVVSKPKDDLNGSQSGACYLYNGDSLALISTLLGGNVNDEIASGGITKLANDNYVIKSSLWDSTRGAATFGNKTTGISGTVGSSNSLVGSAAGETVSSGGVTALTNDNYVVLSPLWNPTSPTDGGAATWGNGASGITGAVSKVTNSLVGISGPITALTNGHYVIASSLWNNGGTLSVGAATWGNGNNGEFSIGGYGTISSANSLIGSTPLDKVGSEGITALTNGHYVVSSPLWNNGAATTAGAVTWGNGSSGITGTVSTANSLVGSTIADRVSNRGIKTLTNGHYVVQSSVWDNTAPVAGLAGAATWGNGSTAGPRTKGAVSSANSLVGGADFDGVSTGVLVLSNGHYIVSSPNWDNGGTADVGAATWGNGNDGSIVGLISTTNSLIGSTDSDKIGIGAIALSNDNYVVFSSNWNDGGTADVGAVTWGNGSTAGPRTVGTVTSANSLIGSTDNDRVGVSVIALNNGNYVVKSSLWDNTAPAAVNAGAVTWGNGSTAGPRTVGTVTSSNSLIGSTDNDFVGEITALTNGHYVVGSSSWSDGGTADVGAATWGNGSTAGPRTVGPVTSSNSLVGSTDNDAVGQGMTVLTNGNYVVESLEWDNGGATDAGAITWGNGSTAGPRTVGTVTSSNSLVGSADNDLIGSRSIIALTNGNYVVLSNLWNNGAITDAGAATLGNGSTGTSGIISTSNSVIGNQASSGLTTAVEESVFEKIYVYFSNDNSGNGRVAVMHTLPTVPITFTFDQIVQINNTTFAARNEMFVSLHPFDEYINQYLQFTILDKVKQIIIEEYLKIAMSYNEIILQKLFIRERNNIGISSMQTPKTL